MFGQKKVFAFTLYPGVTPLDLVAPLTALRDLPPYRTVVVADRIETMETDTSIQLMPAHTFAEVPHPFAVIVPGGGMGTVRAMKDEALLEYVRSAAETAEIVGSTGNGSLILAAAGLLNGRRAATHWAYAELLERFMVTYSRDHWVEDGRFLTSAGGSAGLDMMLHLIARLKGVSRAKLAQLAAEYDPQPPFGPIDWGYADDDLVEMLGAPQRI
jgi:transcriptional regulator GlxA family with amidase domain